MGEAALKGAPRHAWPLMTPTRMARFGDHRFPAPVVATDGAAAIDLYSTVDAMIPRGEVVSVGTGWAFSIPAGWCGLVIPRSGAGSKQRIRLANTMGVIDSDYRGEVVLKLTCDAPVARIRAGKPIAQMVVVPCLTGLVEVASLAALGETARGSGGFGSTD